MSLWNKVNVATIYGTEMTLDAVLKDPMIHLLMRRDGFLNRICVRN